MAWRSMSRKRWRANSASPSIAKTSTAEMEKQRTQARASWRGADKAHVADVYKDLPPVEFIGRETLESPVEVSHLIADNKAADLVAEGAAEVAFAQTPFYAESGGQVGDTGLLLDPETRERVAIVEGAYKPIANAASTAYSCPAAHTRGRSAARDCRSPVAQFHHAESHRDTPAACGFAPGAGDACQAGGQRC